YPFLEENGFDLNTIQEGLQDVALIYKKDVHLKEKIKPLASLYLSKGNCLLHGDFYPGSWLKTTTTVKVIDPEFCFFGKREYDLGVMIAHLKMAQVADNQLNIVLTKYNQSEGFSKELTNQFIGMELIRRIIGLAQLPLELTLEEKQNLLEEARMLVIDSAE
ncbi:MAG: phosphotransferase, partial [Spirosomaceae bacterium]|nr:phosphotransferase [Spirosomataceae bacterium]